MARLVAIIGVLLFALVGVSALAAQYTTTVEESQPQITVENESFTVNANSTNAFNESRRDVVYNDTVEVYQNGSKIEGDGNWTWNAGNGTLTVPLDANTELADNESATITYRYTEPTNEQQAIRDVTLLPSQLGQGLGIIVAAALLFTALVLAGRQR